MEMLILDNNQPATPTPEEKVETAQPVEINKKSKKNEFIGAIVVAVVAIAVLAGIIIHGIANQSNIIGTWNAATADNQHFKVEFTDKEMIAQGQKTSYKVYKKGKDNNSHYVTLKLEGVYMTVAFPEDGSKTAVLVVSVDKDHPLDKAQMLLALNRDNKPSFSAYEEKYAQ